MLSEHEQTMVSMVADIFAHMPPVFGVYDEEPFRNALEVTWVALHRENAALMADDAALVAEAAAMPLAPTTADATAGQVPLDALAALELVSSEWKVLTEIDYLRADVQHLQDVAEAAEQLYQAFHKPSMVRWEDTVKLWMSCLHEALRQAGYLREKADAE